MYHVMTSSYSESTGGDYELLIDEQTLWKHHITIEHSHDQYGTSENTYEKYLDKYIYTFTLLRFLSSVSMTSHNVCFRILCQEQTQSSS